MTRRILKVEPDKLMQDSAQVLNAWYGGERFRTQDGSVLTWESDLRLLGQGYTVVNIIFNQGRQNVMLGLEERQ